jgi:hypothetical protein
MKPVDKNKLKNFSLNDVSNFNKELDVDVEDVMNKYTELLAEYIHFILDNIKIKKCEYANFIISRGLDTVTNIFTNILYYTKNLELAFFHSQKSFYFYVEFICQISEAEKLFLQLSSRDAMIYVYKKTLFDLNNDFVKNIEECSKPVKEKFDTITKRISIAKKMLHFVITTTEPRGPYIKLFEGLTCSLNKVCISTPLLDDLELLFDMLYQKIEDIDCFYKMVGALIKNVTKNPATIKKCIAKLQSDDLVLLTEHIFE